MAYNREARYRAEGFVTKRRLIKSAPSSTDLVRVQCEVGSQQAACVGVVVVVNLIHVVRRVPDLHVYASVGHGLPLDTLAPEES